MRMSKLPLIAGIRHNALDDGPGIRTSIFFKGCILKCVWCHNPECISSDQELLFTSKICEGCGECSRVCPSGAIEKKWPFAINRNLCDFCGKCVQECPSSALSVVGTSMSVSEITKEVLKDKTFYDNSGGGATLSGGEPTLYMDFAGELAKMLKDNGIHVCLETCGDFVWNNFAKKLLPYLDIVYIDMKFFDAQAHLKYTGHDNSQIRQNILNLHKTNQVQTLVRIPLIPGLTDSPENLKASAQWLKKNGIKKIALLPYNPLWTGKATGLGKALEYHCDKWMTQQEQDQAFEFFRGFNLTDH